MTDKPCYFCGKPGDGGRCLILPGIEGSLLFQPGACQHGRESPSLEFVCRECAEHEVVRLRLEVFELMQTLIDMSPRPPRPENH